MRTKAIHIGSFGWAIILMNGLDYEMNGLDYYELALKVHYLIQVYNAGIYEQLLCFEGLVVIVLLMKYL